MKDCKDFQKDLPAFLEGLLPDDERKVLEEHLAVCRICSAAVSDLKKAGAVLSALEEIEPPPWFTQKIMARVREESERRERSLLRRFFFPLQIKVPIQAFATIAVVIMAVYLFWNTEPEMKDMRTPVEIAREVPREKAGTISRTEDRGLEPSSPAQKKPTDEPAVSKSKKSPSQTGESEAAPASTKDGEFVPPPAGTSPPVSTRKGDIFRGDVDIAREERAGLEYQKRSATERAVKSERPPVVGGMPPAPVPAAPLPRETGVISQLADETIQREKIPEGYRARSPDIEKDRAEKKVYGAVSPTTPGLGVVQRTKKPYTSITMTVRDRESAAREVATILKRYGARNVIQDQTISYSVVSAEIPSVDISELVKKLDLVGVITERVIFPETRSISIKITSSGNDGSP